MRSCGRKTIQIMLLLFSILLLSSCSKHEFAPTESKLLEAKDLAGYVGDSSAVIIDMQDEEAYAQEHVAGAVNLPVDEIMISVPVKNMLTSAKKLTKAMNKIGVCDDQLIIAYDTNGTSAARFLWTLFMYGHENILVVNGGLSAIKAAGIETNNVEVEAEEGNFNAAEPSQNWLAEIDEVLAQVNEPAENVVLLDVRTDAEYYADGKIPTSIMMDYSSNYYSDGSFKDVEATRINYLQEKIYPEDEIIIYCQTSVRAAPVFLELYNAGYRNIRIFDGAYLQWTNNPADPIEMPEGAAPPSKKDAS